VISLAGILHGDFQRVHVTLPRRILDACGKAGVERLVHVSALKAASDAPSAYLRSKAEAEALLRAAESDSFHCTILRPSVLFGTEDRFLNTFARLLRTFPAMALAAPNARFQPVYVNDVAQAIVTALTAPATFGQIYELCGPHQYTLRQLVEYVMHTLGIRRIIVPLGASLSYLEAWLLEHLPGQMMTRDNLRSMQVANVCACEFPPVFGISPAPLEAVVPMYIGGVTPRSRYRWFRFRARR
jgi:uncharacterized protein YbjT (DUF2867 family)